MKFIVCMLLAFYFTSIDTIAQDCPANNANDLDKALTNNREVLTSYEVKKNEKREVIIFAKYKTGISITLTYGGCESFYTLFELGNISVKESFNVESDTLAELKKILEGTPFSDADWKTNLINTLGSFNFKKNDSIFIDQNEFVNRTITVSHNKKNNIMTLKYRENIKLLF